MSSCSGRHLAHILFFGHPITLSAYSFSQRGRTTVGGVRRAPVVADPTPRAAFFVLIGSNRACSPLLLTDRNEDSAVAVRVDEVISGALVLLARSVCMYECCGGIEESL